MATEMNLFFLLKITHPKNFKSLTQEEVVLFKPVECTKS